MGLSVTVDIPCPYCADRNEFDASVVAVETLDILAPRRRLRRLTRRLVVTGADVFVRLRFLRKSMARLDEALTSARAVALDVRRKR